MRQIGSDRLRKAILLLIGGVPCLLRLHGCILPECGESDLATTVLDTLPPRSAGPHTLRLGVAFQGCYGLGAILATEVTGEDLFPSPAVPAIIPGTTGRHQMQMESIGLGSQAVGDLTGHQGVFPA